jgi:hypothetical protein
MKQRLGEKKQRWCEEIAGRPYQACYVSAKWGHFVAECWFGEGERLLDCDHVDWAGKTHEPKIRGGQIVPEFLR